MADAFDNIKPQVDTNLTIKAKVNQYRKNGANIFVYALSGSKESIEEYKESQGSYYREDENGNVLYFSQRIVNVGDSLTQTSSGRFQVLSDLEAESIEIDAHSKKFLGKLSAIQQFTGMSRAQLQQKIMDSLAE